MAKFLILSYRHTFLPFANRLLSEGHDVATLVSSEHFDQAWEPRLPKLRRDSEELRLALKEAYTGERVVLSNSTRSQALLLPQEDGAMVSYGPGVELPEPGVVLGFWWDEGPQAPHLWIPDVGVWPGGLGPHLLGGGTLIRLDWHPQAVGGLLGQLGVGPTARGLHQVQVSQEPQMVWGWGWLHTHAFVSELEELGQVLAEGQPPVLPKKYVTVLPLTLSPWPVSHDHLPKPLASPEVEVEGLTPQLLQRVFWHDVTLAGGSVRVGGLDGMVGVARGAADNHALSQARALEIAHRTQLSGLQYRADVGWQVQKVLGELEHRYGLSV